MATTDDRGGPVDTTRVIPAVDGPVDGDDIEVVPAGPGDPSPPSRVRAAWALAGLLAVLVVVGVVALIARNHDSNPAVAASPTTIPTKPIVSKTPPKSAVKPKATPKVTVPVVVAPAQPQTGVTSPAVAPQPTAPPAAVVIPATIAAPPKQYGASALTWTAPGTLTIAAGHSGTLSVTAHNPTAGTVTLSHPLSCTPRLDHSEMCPEMVQLIPSGGSASAQYTIDAHGIAPGHYVLKIEGVLSVPVTVSA